jgi:hypothetical protein
MTSSNRLKNKLVDAFQEDHAILGKGFFELCQSLRAKDLDQAKAIARKLDAEAGAPMAFEEAHFYPALRPLLGDAEVDRMEADHRIGLEVIKALSRTSSGESLSADVRVKLLHDAEAMSTHIAECGELFGAIGRLEIAEQQGPLNQLMAWRQKRSRPYENSMSSRYGARDLGFFAVIGAIADSETGWPMS